MLRLRPSELTLTPEDIEETFSRIARRQALRNAPNLPSHGSIRNGRPTLRRGPQRAVQDAITVPSAIPLTSPQSQQAMHVSTQGDIQHDSSTPPASQRREATQAASSVPRILQLPFRIGRPRRDSATHSTADEQVDQAATSSHSSQSQISIRNAAELRGGGRAKRKEKSSVGNSSHGHEPPEDRLPEFPAASLQPGTIILQGRFAGHNDPQDVPYVFDEIRVPQTEPRRRPPRRDLHLRSFSSGSAPRRHQRTRSSGSVRSADLDSFTIRSRVAQFYHGSRGDSRGQRHFGSEASNNSGTYSFYELPSSSRHSSNSHQELLQRSYDGAVAPTDVVRGSASPSLSAVTAVAEGQPSPLDPYSEYYQEFESVGRNLSRPLSSRQTATTGPATPRDFLFPEFSHHGRQSPRFTNSTSRPNTPRLHSPYESSLWNRRQHANATRASQRSSENAPVNSAGQLNGPSRHGQVQTHRAAYERLSNAQQALGEVTHRGIAQPAPRDASNRSRANAMLMMSPFQGQHVQDHHHLPSSPPSLGALSRGDIDVSPRTRLSPIFPPRQTSVGPDAVMLTRLNSRIQRPLDSTFGPPIRLQPPHDQPSTFLSREPARLPLRGTFSSAPRPSTARTHRRVPPEQRDQENSGAVDEGLMRLEEAAFRARYAADAEEVMDETPPPIGRIERRMGD